MCGGQCHLLAQYRALHWRDAGYSNTYCAKNDKDISVGLLMIAPVKGRAAEEGKRKKQPQERISTMWRQFSSSVLARFPAREGTSARSAVVKLQRKRGDGQLHITGEALTTCDTLVEEVVRLHLRVLDAKHERGDLALLSSPRSC
uniref:Uncharacterized protein n=1 Tax=Oryza barthii TaxID=65489 RepID=A0A0D3FXY8_9ORYZ